MKKQLFVVITAFLFLQFCAAEEPETFIVEGKVIDYLGEPVSGAAVICYQSDSNMMNTSPGSFDTARTTSDGEFSFQVSKGNYLSGIVAYRPGLAIGWKDRNIQSGLSPAIRLGKPTVFKGIVTDEAGIPIENADVGILLRNELMSNKIGIDYDKPDPENLYSVKTDSEGRFVFDNIPEGSYANFKVAAPGKALIYVERDAKSYTEYFAAGRDDIHIVLPNEACIKGQVIDEETGQGLANIELSACVYGNNSYRDIFTKTDENGNYEFKQLDSHKYQLRIKDNTKGYGYANVDVESSQTIDNVKILFKNGKPFKVKVFNPADETCIKDVCVTIYQNDDQSGHDIFSHKVLTDINGIAEFMVPPGESDIEVTKLDYGSTLIDQYDFIVNPEIESRMEIALPHSAYIYSGRALDEQGNPLGGVKFVMKGFGPCTVSDSDGWFDSKHEHIFTTGLPSRIRLYVRHEASGFAAYAQINDPNRTGHIKGEVVLKPAHSIKGKVTDPNGKAIPAAYVQLIEGQNCTIIEEVATDSKGQYEIRSVPFSGDDLNYFIVAYAHGYNHVVGGQVPFSDDVTKPIEMQPIELLPADKIVSGIVVDVNEQPVPNAILTFDYPRLLQNYRSLSCPKIITDKQGRFYFKGISEELVTIYANSKTQEQNKGNIIARGGDTDIKIVLGQTLYYSRSLIGTKLPDIKDFGIDSIEEGKKVLLCFFDYEQRPSRNCIIELNKKVQELSGEGIEIAAIQTAKTEQSELSNWIKENNISMQIGTIQTDWEKVRTEWGIEALPWMILTDKEHNVIAEGFSMDELEKKIGENQ